LDTLPENTYTVNTTDDVCLVVINLREDMQVFDGHFPGNPILPGVAQVDWAIGLAEKHLGPLGNFFGLEKIKFNALVNPGDTLKLVLEYDRQRGRLMFRYEREESPISSGIVIFKEG
jgi:3-hydroxymyristoyl/3-hydroxydecanoyl-(acyl carrier protein) dehydratase